MGLKSRAGVLKCRAGVLKSRLVFLKIKLLYMDIKKTLKEITDDLVQKGLTNIKEIKIEPFDIGCFVHAKVTITFL